MTEPPQQMHNTGADTDENAVSAAEPPAFRYVHSSNLPALLNKLGVTLVATTYQAGRVLAFSSAGERCSLLMRAFQHPMGLAVADNRMALVCRNQIWLLVNQTDLITEDGAQPPYEAYYIPRMAHVTGDISGHEIAWGRSPTSLASPPEGDTDDASTTLWIVNTRFCCLATLAPHCSFVPQWKPPFVSELAPGDRCHLNGLAMEDGLPAYVSAFAETDESQGWREHREDGGLVMNITSGEIISRGLAMPHSPRLWNGSLWILDSGCGEFQHIDMQSGARETIVQLPGFTRGLAFHQHYAFVGLSKAREKRTFGDLPLGAKMSDLECAVYVIDMRSGTVAGFLRFEAGCDELFDVQIVPGVRNLNVIGFTKDTVNGIFVLPRGDEKSLLSHGLYGEPLIPPRCEADRAANRLPS